MGVLQPLRRDRVRVSLSIRHEGPCLVIFELNTFHSLNSFVKYQTYPKEKVKNMETKA